MYVDSYKIKVEELLCNFNTSIFTCLKNNIYSDQGSDSPIYKNLSNNRDRFLWERLTGYFILILYTFKHVSLLFL